MRHPMPCSGVGVRRMAWLCIAFSACPLGVLRGLHPSFFPHERPNRARSEMARLTDCLLLHRFAC